MSVNINLPSMFGKIKKELKGIFDNENYNKIQNARITKTPEGQKWLADYNKKGFWKTLLGK